MPLMKGLAPVRRTLKYLEAGKVIFKDRVKIVSVNYNPIGENHKGAREFVFWYLPQVQYKNPNIQIVTFKNMTPSPFIRCFLDNDEEVVIDIDNKDKEEIRDYLKKLLGKSDAVLAAEKAKRGQKSNPANFGETCDRHCICEIPGQVPCPSIIKFPNSMRAKFKWSS